MMNCSILRGKIMGIKVVDHGNLGNASLVILTHFLNMGDHLTVIYHDIQLTSVM